jgi:hypothetical protein
MHHDLNSLELLVSIDHIQKNSVGKVAGPVPGRSEVAASSRYDAIATFARVRSAGAVHPPALAAFFFPCLSTKLLRCSPIVYVAAEPGSRQSFTKAARSDARAAFFWNCSRLHLK